MPSVPAEFRCFQHVNFIFARNLPLKVPFHLRIKAPSDCVKEELPDDLDGAQIDCQYPSPMLTGEGQCAVKKPVSSTHSVANSEAVLSPLKSTPGRLARSQPDELLSYNTHRCVSSYYILREVTAASLGNADEIKQHSNRVCYQSELCVNTQHPTWQWIPVNTLLKYATHTKFILEVYYCCQDDDIAAYTQASEDVICHSGCNSKFSSCVASSCRHPNFERGKCVYRVLLDTTRLHYVAHSIAEADQHLLDQSRKDALDCTILFVKCFDGVFMLSPEMSASPSMVALGAEKADGSWGHIGADSSSTITANTFLSTTTTSPNRVAASHGDFPSRGRAACGAPRGGMSVGDLRSLSVATLAWRNLHRMVLEGRQELLDGIDAAEASCRAQTAQCVLETALRASLSGCNEQLTMAMLTVEQLRTRVEEKQRVLEHQERAFALLHTEDPSLRGASSPQSIALVRQEAGQRTEQRFKLAQSRQRYVRALVSIYTVALRSSVGAGPTRDMINGAPLPFFPERPFSIGIEGEDKKGAKDSAKDKQNDRDKERDRGGSFVPPQEPYGESLALGHVAHAAAALAVVYRSALPFPLVVAGARSRVLSRPDRPPRRTAATVNATVAASDGEREGDGGLPLFYQRAADRPRMRAAMMLLVCDLATLAQAMGKDAEKVYGFGLRLAASLQYLLSHKSN